MRLLSVSLKHIFYDYFPILFDLSQSCIINPQFMWSYFKEKPMPYNLRDGSQLVLPKTKSAHFSVNSLQFRGCLLWNNLPMSVKNCQSLNKFKLELTNLGNIHCTCLVCRLSIFFMIIFQFYCTIYDICM